MAAVEAVVEIVAESRKLFVGGIPAAANESELRCHFERFGAVRSMVVMRDKETGRGRGFGFVEFEEEAAAAMALGDGATPRHFICDRLVDVRRARVRPRHPDLQALQHQQLEQGAVQGNNDSQPDKNLGDDSVNNVVYGSNKLFIGGLRDNVTEEDFRAYFEAFGTVTDVVVIYDNQTNRSRGFGFVTFDSEEAVGKVMQKTFHNLNGAWVEAKIAIPKDAQYYRHGRGRGSRPFAGRGPGPYDGTPYQPYNDQHGFYNGYVPQPVPPPPYYPGVFYGMGGYPYANAYQNQGVMANVPNMVARRPLYSSYTPMYIPYGGFDYRAGYPGGSAFVHYGVNGAIDYNNDQASIDVQDVESAATMFEHMKLGS